MIRGVADRLGWMLRPKIREGTCFGGKIGSIMVAWDSELLYLVVPM